MALISRAWLIKSSSPSKSGSPKTAASRHRKRRHHRDQTSSNDPTSPRVNCMGCIKPPSPPPLCEEFYFFPLSTSFFSSNGSSPVTADSNREMAATPARELDPPLPAEKRNEKVCAGESLWRRRCREREELCELKLCRPAGILSSIPK